MTIVERFLKLGLPATRCVVIGSGILDALQLRPSADIDLVVDEALFDELQQVPEWRAEVRYGETVLLREDVEVWMSWGSEGRPNFKELYATSLTVGGVHFAHPEVVLAWKKAKRRPKDLQDIDLLEGYLQHDTANR